MSNALGQVKSELIIKARGIYAELVRDYTEYSDQEIKSDCINLFKSVGIGEVSELSSLAKLCDTVLISGRQAAFISNALELAEKIKELK